MAPEVPDFVALERIALAHRAPVWSVAFTALGNGRAVLASCGDSAVQLWDPDSGNPRGEPLRGHTKPVRCVAFTRLPDGRTLLASGGDDNTVRLWALNADGEARQGEPFNVSGQVWGLAFGTLADGRTLLACGDDLIVRLWDLSSGGPFGDPLTGHGRQVTSVAFGRLPGGRTVLGSGSADGTIRLWLPESGTVHGDLPGHDGSVSSVAFATLPDGRTLLASGGSDGTVRRWDADARKPIGSVSAGDGRVWSVAFGTLGNGRILLASGSDSLVRLWDAVESTPFGDPLGDHTMPVLSVAFDPRPEGRGMLAGGRGDGTVRIWEPTTASPHGAPLAGHASPVRSLATCAVRTAGDRPLVVSGGDDGIIRMWDGATGELRGVPITAHAGRVRSVACATLPSGRVLVVSGGDDETVRIWDAGDGTAVGQPLRGHTGAVLSVACVALPGGRVLVVSGGHDETVCIWDAGDGTAVGEPLRGHAGPVRSIACLQARGQLWLATGSEDGTVRVWDVGGRTARVTLQNGATRVWSVALTTVADNRVLLAGGGERKVLLWDLTEVAPKSKELTGHTDSVRSVAFVANPAGEGVLLVSGSDDGTVRLWDPVAGTPQGNPLTGHAGPVLATAFVPQPEGWPLIASGGEDGAVRLWAHTDSAVVKEKAVWPGQSLQPLAPVPSRTEAPAVRDDTATEDILGRRILAKHLHAVLDHLAVGRSVKDDSQGTAVVHIDGRWGSGKTTLVSLLRRRLRQRSEDSGSLGDSIIIRYDAWRESAIAPEWWALATAINRAVRAERAGATRMLMSLLGSMSRLASSRPALSAVALLVAAGCAHLAGLWRSMGEISGWLTALTAVVAIGLSAGRVLFWTSPAFGKLYLKSDGAPLGDIAKIVGRLRRWSPRPRRPHRAVDTLCLVWTLVATLVIVRLVSQGDAGRSAAAGVGAWIVHQWLPVVVTIVVGAMVWTSWRRRPTADEEHESDPEKPSGAVDTHGQPERSARSRPRSVQRRFTARNAWLTVTSRFLCIGIATTAIWAGWVMPLPSVRGWLLAALAVGLPLVGIGCHAWWIARGSRRSRRPIILIIDDLDRCTTERAVKLLETVHTVLRQRTAPRFFRRWRAPASLIVLVLADGRWIRAAFESTYQPAHPAGSLVHDLGADFLQKLFDHTVLVPALARGQIDVLLNEVTKPWVADGTVTGEPVSVPPSGGQGNGFAPPPERSSAQIKQDAVELINNENPGRLRTFEVNARLSNQKLSLEDAIEVEARRVEREASPVVTAQRAAHLLTNYAELMPANPRLIKRIANTWGMLCAVQSHLHVRRALEAPPEDHVARAAIMFVRFPALVDDLLSCERPPSINPHVPSPQPEPWKRPDVLKLLTTANGHKIQPAEIGRCYGRWF